MLILVSFAAVRLFTPLSPQFYVGFRLFSRQEGRLICQVQYAHDARFHQCFGGAGMPTASTTFLARLEVVPHRFLISSLLLRLSWQLRFLFVRLSARLPVKQRFTSFAGKHHRVLSAPDIVWQSRVAVRVMPYFVLFFVEFFGLLFPSSLF
jgi:hypothetical protein